MPRQRVKPGLLVPLWKMLFTRYIVNKVVIKQNT